MNTKDEEKRTSTFYFILFASIIAISAAVGVILQPSSTQRPSVDSCPFAEKTSEDSNAQGKDKNGNSIKVEDIADNKKLQEKICRMEQYGAEGAVSIHAKDTTGIPIEGASVRLGFTQPDQDSHSGIVDGKTDRSGLFSAKKTSNWACFWTVTKEGYHASKGKVLFTHSGSQKAFLEGRWTDEPIEVNVELKKVSGAKFIHGRRYNDIVFLPTNLWVGFDFTACDLVKPYGLGKHPHVLLRSESDGVSPFCKGATSGYTNVLHLKVAEGGLSIATETGESDSPFMSLVPISFDTNILTFVYARTEDKILEDNLLPGKDYIIFSSKFGKDQRNEPLCGIMRNLEFFPGQLRLEYFVNAIPGDQRLDADVSSPLDMGK